MAANKKYSQDRKFKMDEYGNNFVTGNDPMVGRDSPAGLPEEKVMKKYPKNRARAGGYLDDSMAEIDAIQLDSQKQRERNLSHQK